MNLDDTEEYVYLTYIYSSYETNKISMIDDAYVYHKNYAPLISSNNQEYVFTGT